MPEVTAPLTDHADCAALVKQQVAALGCDVNVSDARPGMVMPGGLDEFSMCCPHGVLMWMEPTAEQWLAWARDAAR